MPCSDPELGTVLLSLQVGRMLQASLVEKHQQKCGFASLADVATGLPSSPAAPSLQPTHPCHVAVIDCMTQDTRSTINIRMHFATDHLGLSHHSKAYHLPVAWPPAIKCRPQH